MAVYAGQAKRKRTTGLVAVAALVVGLVIGVLIGHGTATTIDDQVTKGRDGGRDLVTALQVLPLEYSQAISGGEGTTLIGDTVDRAADQLNVALDDAPWLGPTQRTTATDAVQAVKTAAASKVPATQFEAVVTASSAKLDGVFGLPVTTGG